MRNIIVLILTLFASFTAAFAQKAGDVIAAPAQKDLNTYFSIEPLTDTLIERMKNKSLPADKIDWGKQTLCYLRLLHCNREGKTQIGELVCNKAIAQDLIDIFRSLYKSGYRIDKMVLVDNYGGNDDLSMRDDNTSCFNYRLVDGTNHLSNHGRGLAIDVNPFYNPWVRGTKVDPAEARPYAFNRKKVKAPVPIIDTTDLCYKLFRKHGFTWGGAWRSSKDYQHFEKKL